MLICAPVTSRSGYGDHARDLVRAFVDHRDYVIKIIDVPWGDCPRNALDVNKPEDKAINDRILADYNLPQQPDVYVDIRIPNEFQQFGKFNIGITAGIETSAVSQQWIEGCNKMDLIIVPSEHSKGGFVNTIYDKLQNLPDGKQKKIGEVKLEKSIEVLFEGIDETIYRPINKKEMSEEFFDYINNTISERFAFLHVGQWGKGGFGEDRKNIGVMIKTFYEAFANKKKQPALILKTSGATFSILDKEEIIHKINSVKSRFPSDWKLPNVYLLHGDLSKEEMNYLYNHPKVKAFVSFTHGEGFGRPLLEATMTGLPVIASNWSGHIDFLDSDKALLLGGGLNKVPKSAVWENIIIPESQWFTINELEAYKVLNYCFKEYEDVKRKAKVLMNQNNNKFKLSDMTKKLKEVIDKYTSNLPKAVGLNLPKLKKVDNTKSKLELPKLKRI